MTKKQEIKVVKIPLNGSVLNKEQVFPRMPRLYLELLENKNKIKSDLVDLEHYVDVDEKEQRIDMLLNIKNHKSSNSSNSSISSNSSNKKDDKDELEYLKDDKDYKNELNNLNELENLNDKNYKDELENNKDKLENNKDELELENKNNKDELENNKDELELENKNNKDELENNKDELENNKDELENKKSSESEKNSDSEDSDNDLSFRLKELLKKDEIVKDIKKDKQDKYSIHRDKKGHSIQQKKLPPILTELENGGFINQQKLPPSLSELEKGGFINQKEFKNNQPNNQPNPKTNPNPNSKTNPKIEQENEDFKRELLFKFDLLRKSYPLSTIPEYNIHTDKTVLENAYNDCIRRLSLDSTVENYKTYLVYGFMGTEFILGNFLGFDMHGFTQQQIISMHSYEKLLIELGEKSYIPTGSNWPVEVRLLFMIIMNAAFFVISKMMMKKTGANLMGLINGMTSSSKSNVPNNTSKRKMKPPTIDLDDIPDL